jgi:hypothetical protein
MADEDAALERTASCACGNLTAKTSGEPVDVYLCSCLDCQRGTGSAFSYAALFPLSAVTVVGEKKQYAHHGDSGRTIESDFCPTCGTAVAFRAEGLPGVVGVPVGCFADPGFAKPRKMFWAKRRHRWLDVPAGIRIFETQ